MEGESERGFKKIVGEKVKKREQSSFFGGRNS